MNRRSPFRLLGLTTALTLAAMLLPLATVSAVDPTPEPTPAVTPTPTPVPTPSPTPTPVPTPSPTPTPVPVPPTATVLINDGATTFTDPKLTLKVTATAGTAPVTQMRFSQDAGATWTAFVPYATSAQIDLTAGARWGTRAVMVEVLDSGGQTGRGSDAATYVRIARTSMAVTQSYLFKTSLNYDTAKIATTETITVTNTSGGLLGYLNLSVHPRAFGEFSLTSISVDGARPAGVEWTNNANLLVPMGRNLRVNETATITIAFTDTATSSISTSLRARLSKANSVMQVSQWFPIISDGHALRYPGDAQYTRNANFRIELSLNRSMKVAMPGTIISSSSTKVVAELKNARDFNFGVSPAFKTASGSVDGITVRVYYVSGSGRSALSYAKSALQSFNTKFGPYPYKTFIIAQSTRPSGGNEYPGIIFIGSSLLGNSYVIKHEVAHQWFYGLLGNNQNSSPWLDEAFAEWAGRGYKGASYCSSKYVNSAITSFPNTPANLTGGSCNSYDQTVYFKGSYFIAGVRSRMGATAFDKSMRALVANNRFGVITTKMVIDNWLAYTPSASRSSLSSYMHKYLKY